MDKPTLIAVSAMLVFSIANGMLVRYKNQKPLHKVHIETVCDNQSTPPTLKTDEELINQFGAGEPFLVNKAMQQERMMIWRKRQRDIKAGIIRCDGEHGVEQHK